MLLLFLYPEEVFARRLYREESGSDGGFLALLFVGLVIWAGIAVYKFIKKNIAGIAIFAAFLAINLFALFLSVETTIGVWAVVINLIVWMSVFAVFIWHIVKIRHDTESISENTDEEKTE